MSWFRRRLMMGQKTSTDGHKIDWVYMPVGSWLDTGYYPNQNTKVYAKFQMTAYNVNYACIFGGGTANNQQCFILQKNNSTANYRFVINTTQVAATSLTLYPTTWYEATLDKTQLTVGSSTQSSGYSGSDFTSQYSLGLNCSHRNDTASNNGSTIFEAVKIWDNDVLVRDFVPWIKDNGTIGMFDKVSNKFYGSESSTPFQYFITDNTYDAEIEYLQTDGNQYFILPVMPSELTDAIEITFRRTENTAQQRFCHSASVSTFQVYANGSHRLAYSKNGYWTNVSSDNLSLLGLFKHTVKVDYYNRNVFLDTNEYTIASGGRNGTGNLVLFGRYNSNAICKSIIYGVKFWRSGTLVYDLIPVRKNGIGYLYDKVNQQLYYNFGTGNFTLGYDKYNDLSDYTLLDYISNNTFSTSAAFINTMIATDSNTLVDISFKNTQNPISTQGILMGKRTTSSSGRFEAYFNITDSAIAIGYNTGRTNLTSGFDNNKHRIQMGNSEVIIDGVSELSLSGTFTSGMPFLLGATNGDNTTAFPSGGSGFIGNIYYCKIYQNNTLVRDFVPVLHPANVYGMFDKVENKFYASASATDYASGGTL